MKDAGVPVGVDEYRGLYVSPAEAGRILARPDDARFFPPDSPALQAIDRISHCDGSRLRRLIDAAGLSPGEAGVIVLAFASECDPELERVISFVQDDVTKKRPRVDLAVRLFGGTAVPAASVAMFDPAGTLRRLQLIRLFSDAGQSETPLIAQQIALDHRIWAFLAGGDSPDERLLSSTIEFAAESDTETLGLGSEFTATVATIAAFPAVSLPVPVLGLSGADETSRLHVARRIARGSGLGCIAVRFDRLAGELGPDIALTVALREGALSRSAVVLDGLDATDAQRRSEIRRRVRLERLAPLVILSTTAPLNWPIVSLEIPRAPFDGLVEHWDRYLPAGVFDHAALRVLAGKFRLSQTQIVDAAEGARAMAFRRDPTAPAVTSDDIYAAARAQSTPILSDMARKVPPHHSWDDLIVTREVKEQLREICAHMEHRATVLDEWGLARRLALGRGLTVLFAGNSGTGKTMAAGVMSGELGLDLYKIDLSGLVSKYIGETEKNLSGIFREAESSNAILFFDEADALFGKRSEVKDAHDRYANIETAYLLQKMEEYEGIVILATNLKMNLDEAFLRRLSFVVDFPMPEEEERIRIWRSTIPPELPLAADVDTDFLASRFRLAGGNIRNIVLAAAFLAAGEGSDVRMEHFIRATRREYQKLGRMVTAADFGEHISVLRDVDI